MKIRQISCALATVLMGVAAAYGDSFKAGDIFYGTQQSNTVAVYQPNGTLVTTISVPGGGDANFLAFDTTGRLYVSESTGTIQRFSNTGASLGTFATTVANEQFGALVFNKAGDLFAGTTTGGLSSGNGIFEFNPSGGLIKNYIPTTVVAGMALEANQSTMLFSDETGKIFALNLMTGIVTTFATESADVDGLLVLPDGTVLAGTNSPVIYRLDSHGNIIGTYNAPDDSQTAGLALGLGGNSFWAADYFNSKVDEFNLSGSSAVDTVGGSGNRAAGVAIFPDLNPPVSAPEPGNLPVCLAASVFLGVWLLRRRKGTLRV